LHGNLPADAGYYSPRGLIVSPTDANRLVVAFGRGTGGKHGIIVSKDGGVTWRQTLDAQFNGNGPYRMDGSILAASPADANRIYCASDNAGVYGSADGGETWKHLGPDHVLPRGIVIDRVNSNHLWIVSASHKEKGKEFTGALLDSTDGGLTWQQISDDPPNEFIQDPVNPKVLYGLLKERQVVRSDDGGRTWHPCIAGLPPFSTQDEAQGGGNFSAIAALGDTVLIGSHAGQFYRLNKTSNRWEKIPWESVDEQDWWGRMRSGSYQHFGSAMGFIAVDPHDSKHWAFTDWFAIYQTYDAGKHWKLTLNGIEMLVIHCVTQDMFSPATVHVGAADLGYFRSIDGGENFAWMHDGISNNVKQISACKSSPNRLYAVGAQKWGWLANQVFTSADDGLKWTQVTMEGLPDMDQNRCNTVAVNPTNPDDLYLAVSGISGSGAGGVYRGGSGKVWSYLGQGLPTGMALFHHDIWGVGPELAVSGDGTKVCISIDRGKIFYWDQGKSLWKAVEIEHAAPHAVVADPSTPSRFYIAGRSAGLLRSDDGGQTWQRINDRNIFAVAVDTVHPERLAAITDEDVLYSRDNGVSWWSIGRSLPHRGGGNVVAFAGDRVVIGTGGSGVFWAELAEAVANGTKLAPAMPASPRAQPLSTPPK
jgi:photosystem II stability/assembly factor-like uncharacterized protein